MKQTVDINYKNTCVNRYQISANLLNHMTPSGFSNLLCNSSGKYEGFDYQGVFCCVCTYTIKLIKKRKLVRPFLLEVATEKPTETAIYRSNPDRKLRRPFKIIGLYVSRSQFGRVRRRGVIFKKLGIGSLILASKPVNGFENSIQAHN